MNQNKKDTPSKVDLSGSPSTSPRPREERQPDSSNESPAKTSGTDSRLILERIERLERICDAFYHCTARQVTNVESVDKKLYLEKVFSHKTA